MLVGQLSEHAGGGERAALGLAAHLPADRWDVTLVTTRESTGAPLEAVRDAGVRVVDLGRSSRWDVHAVPRLVRTLRERRTRILHAHMFGANVWGATVGRAARVPVVIAHEQTWSYEGQPLRKVADAAIGRLANAFIAVSTADAERMHRIERVPRDRIRMIPNAWIPRPGESADADVRSEVGLSAATPVVGTVAVLRPQKRLDILFEAFGRVRAAMPEARLVIAGDARWRPQLQERATALGIDDAVHWLGMRNDVDAVLRSFDVFAMSSDFEGTPLAALEAMAAGVPVVATDVGGLPDIVDPGRTGLLVPRRDPGALAEAIVGLLRDPAGRQAMGAAAAEHAQAFSVERHAERVAELYEELLSRGG
jgi:glycosyltransferase involved in cell wall biosynthesis